MKTKANSKLLLTISQTDYTKMYFPDPDWEGSYNYYNRHIYKTCLDILNEDNKEEQDVEKYLQQVNTILTLYKTYKPLIKQIANSNLLLRFTRSIQNTIIHHVRYNDIESIIIIYNNMIDYITKKDLDNIQKEIKKIFNICIKYEKRIKMDKIIKELIFIYPTNEVINRIIELKAV